MAAGINGKGFDYKPLAWWITLLHHICSVIELETTTGPISVLPNYANVDMDVSKIPAWVHRAVNKIRTPMSKDAIGKRWNELQSSAIPSWTFYTMPHSVLASMGDTRPTRPYWPRPGEDEDQVIQHGIAILARGRNGSLPRVWARHAKIDGYHFSPKEDAKETKAKKEIKPKKKDGNRLASETPIAEQNTAGQGRAANAVPSATQEGKYRLVSSGAIDSERYYRSGHECLAIHGTE